MKTAHQQNTFARFTFTAKAPREGNRTPMNKIKYSEERDEETGYGYFGARYYDPDISALWLSVDPMADKYPGTSPYAYCAWNPVKLIDPDGEWPWEPKHIRNARRFARRNNGTLSISEQRNGVKLATVGYLSSTEFGKTFTVASFAPSGYTSRGTIKETSGIAELEFWAESPSETPKEAAIKYGFNLLYDLANGPYMLLTGNTIAGSEVNSDDKLMSFLNVTPSSFSKLLRATNLVTSLKYTKGLQGYNEYVKKNPNIIKRLSRSGAGLSFKRNQDNLKSLNQFEITNRTLQQTSNCKKWQD